MSGKNAEGRIIKDLGRAADTMLEGQAALAIRDQLIGFGRKVPDSAVPFQPNFTLGGTFAEVDLETANVLIEVTNGRSSKAFQVREKYLNPVVNPEGKPVIVLAPNFKSGQINGALEAGAAKVVKSIPELVEYLKNLKK
jgi:hypothetical protein